MGAQNGKDLLIKMDLTGDGQFATVAGLRATRISFNAESVDVTSLESQGGCYISDFYHPQIAKQCQPYALKLLAQQYFHL